MTSGIIYFKEREVSFAVGVIKAITTMILSMSGVIPLFKFTYSTYQIHHWVIGAILIFLAIFIIPRKWQIKLPIGKNVSLIIWIMVLGFGSALVVDQAANIYYNNFRVPSLIDYAVNINSFTSITGTQQNYTFSLINGTIIATPVQNITQPLPSYPQPIQFIAPFDADS